MRLSQLFLAAVAIVLSTVTVEAAPQTPQHRAVTPYVAELNRQCRARDLQDLTAGDLELIMEGFEDRLTLAQRHKVQDAVGYRCARIEAGLTCGNTASLDAFRRLGVLKRFVTEACASGWSCKGFGDCVQTRP
jgi:hypothetical protein